MHAPSRPRPRMLALAGLLTALTLAGCTEKVSGIPLAEGEFEARQSQGNTAGAPAPAPSAVAFARGQEALAKQYAAARAVDPCALHDAAAAAKVTGLTADSIMPSSNLSGCDLILTPEGSLLSVWSISVGAGKVVDSKTRAGATPEQIGGATYLRAAETSNDGRSCRFFLDSPATTGGTSTGSTTPDPTPLNAPSANPSDEGQDAAPAPRTVIDLSVQRRDPKPQAKDPCQVGREYLAEIGKYWVHPALRTDKLTTPELRLAQGDPCRGLAGVSSAMGGPIEAAPTGLYSCTVRLAANNGDLTRSRAMGSVSATFSIKWDPMLLMRNEKTAKEYAQITVAGRPALQKKTEANPANPKLTGDCAVTAVVDENVAIQEDMGSADAPKSLQVVETRANTCELATAAAESVVASIR